MAQYWLSVSTNTTFAEQKKRRRADSSTSPYGLTAVAKGRILIWAGGIRVFPLKLFGMNRIGRVKRI
jgi:hypothetical protein